MLSGSTTPFDGRGFAVLELNCGIADKTFAHELAHTFGMRHHDNLITERLYPWALGYILPAPHNVATVMGCTNGAGGGSCSRILHFSNPERLYQLEATGVHSDLQVSPQVFGAHNACVANLRANDYSTFAPPPPSTAPELRITGPADGDQYPVGSSFRLVASATDAEDGDLRTAVRWTSDSEGFLGIGVGFHVSLNIPGRHLITATVTDSSGIKVPYSIRIDATETDSPLVEIELPRERQVVEGNKVLVKGWAIDASGVEAVTFRLDGRPATLPAFQYGTPGGVICFRNPDVDDPNCPNVGFTAELDTTQLSNGWHNLKATARDPWGNTKTTLKRTFFVDNVVTTTLNPTDDAYVSEANSHGMFGEEPTLMVRASGSGQALHTYLKFHVSGITRPVQSAMLSLVTGPVDLGETQVYWIGTTSWEEGTITWNNAPVDPLLTFPTSSHPKNTRIAIDVSSIVTGNGFYTIGLVAPDAPGQSFSSKEAHESRRPELVVTW